MELIHENHIKVLIRLENEIFHKFGEMLNCESSNPQLVIYVGWAGET